MNSATIGKDCQKLILFLQIRTCKTLNLSTATGRVLVPYSKRREKEAEDAIRCGARLHATSSSKRESPRQSDAWEENMPMELIDDVKVPDFYSLFFGADFVVS